jgi:putative copper export protein
MNLSDPLRELLGFVGAYLALGVVGLRYGVLGPALGSTRADDARGGLLHSIGRRTAALGLVGTVLGASLMLAAVLRTAGARHLAVATVLTNNHAGGAVKLTLYVVAIFGFSMALAGRRPGWPLAAVGAVGAQLSNIVALQWTALVNPVHVLAGSLWIGTLFALMTIAVPRVLTGSQTGQDKALTIADLVYAFSPLALISGGVLVASGIITAWRHLKFVAALWTTSYGIALLVKLAVVAVVFGVGAWNWRRVKPALGTPAASDRLARSARLELVFAGLVLLVTSVLVSLPSPRLPK